MNRSQNSSIGVLLLLLKEPLLLLKEPLLLLKGSQQLHMSDTFLLKLLRKDVNLGVG